MAPSQRHERKQRVRHNPQQPGRLNTGPSLLISPFEATGPRPSGEEEINHSAMRVGTPAEVASVVDYLTEAVLVYNTDGLVVHANAFTERMVGFNPIGKHRSDILNALVITDLDGNPLPVEEMPYERGARGEIVKDFNMRITSQSGRVYLVLASAMPIWIEGQRAGVVSVWNDVTGPQLLIEENRRQRELLEKIIEYTPAGITLLRGPRHIHVMANPAYTRLAAGMGVLIGRSVAEVWKEVAGHMVPMLDYVYASGQAYSINDMRLTITRAGRKVEGYLSFSFTPMFDANRQVDGILVMVEDTTDQARARQAIERANQDLQDFAFIASHDLQEPLRKVRAFGALLAEQYSEALDSEGRDYIQRMSSATQRMTEMLDGLLAYSRISTQASPFSPVDLRLVAEGVLSDLETRLADTGGTVELGDLAVIEADPVQMRQLLQNLIGNAIKYHRADLPPRVRVWAEPVEGSADWVRLIVADNGVGFDDQLVERIFQPFRRLHGRREFEGAGMGLAICKKIVERHGGGITARSVIGQGSTFVITLPIRRE